MRPPIDARKSTSASILRAREKEERSYHALVEVHDILGEIISSVLSKVPRSRRKTTYRAQTRKEIDTSGLRFQCAGDVLKFGQEREWIE